MNCWRSSGSVLDDLRNSMTAVLSESFDTLLAPNVSSAARI